MYKVGASTALLIAGVAVVAVLALNGAIILANEVFRRRHHHHRHRHRATHLDFTVGPVSAKHQQYQ